MKKSFARLLTVAFVALMAFSATVSFSAQTFSEWLAANSVPANLQGPGDDPAGDGVANLVKFALGLDPLVGSRDQLPVPALANIGERELLTLSIPKNSQAVGVQILVEASSDLLTWSGSAVEVLLETDTLLQVAVETSAARFLRLRIPAPPLGPMPDAYLYVVGGRANPTNPNGASGHPLVFDPDLDNVDTSLTNPEQPRVDVRSILIADVDYTDRSVGNWRRASVFLPTQHPETGGGLHWTYIHSGVHYHNGRIYVGPATFNGPGPVTADFVAYADVNLATGDLGEFSTSARFPAPAGGPTNQRIGATAIVEVDGVHYFYLIAGNQDEDAQTNRILFAALDPATGAPGEWQTNPTPFPTTTWFNAGVGIGPYLMQSGGTSYTDWLGLGSSRQISWVVPDSGGAITSDWTTRNFDWIVTTVRFEHSMLVTEAGGNRFLHLVGGNSDAVHFSYLENNLPTADEWTGWEETTSLPATRRRASAAGYGDMIIMTGGSTTTSYVATVEDLVIGVVGPDGQISSWDDSAKLPQTRSFHGSVIVPAGLAQP